MHHCKEGSLMEQEEDFQEPHFMVENAIHLASDIDPQAKGASACGTHTLHATLVLLWSIPF